MLNDPKDALLYILLYDAAILAFAIVCFWAGVFVAQRLGYTASYGLGALGLTKPKPGYFVGAGLGAVVGIGALGLSFFLTTLSALILEELGYSTQSNVQEPLMRGIGEWMGESPATAISAAIFVVVFFGPVIEEIIFRGAIFGGLYKLSAALSGRLRGQGKGAGKVGERVSLAFAALVSSTSFALLHLEPVLLPALFALAIILCALYRWT